MNKTWRVIIINYNTAVLTAQTVSSFFAKHRNADTSFEIVIVDNNSNPYEKNKLREYFATHRFPNLEIIWSEHNLGFGGGNNLGAKNNHSEYLLFLNSDTIITENILTPLEKSFEENEKLEENGRVAILSPLLKLENGDWQAYMAGDFPTLLSTIFRKQKKYLDDGKSPAKKYAPATQNNLQFCDFVSGCALAISSDIFAKVGGFSPEYFMYFEDIDLCKKVSLLGRKTALLTNISLIHLGGKSIAQHGARKKPYYRSQDIFFQKYYGFFRAKLLQLIAFPYRQKQLRSR